MKSALLFLALLSPLSAEPGSDLLRFKNGDTLHGQYQGLDEGPLVLWRSEEVEESIAFETRNLRKLSLNGGRARKLVTSVGLVTLMNGDIIPGELIAMDSDAVTLQTQFAGLLSIPRDHIQSIQPNRHGGGVIYAGPFSEEQWQVLEYAKLPQKDEEEDLEEQDNEENKEEKKPEKEEKPKPWTYGSSAWYSNSPSPLCLKIPLPDLVSIRFHLAWQNRLNANFALMADFTVPELEKALLKDEENAEGEINEEGPPPEEEPQDKLVHRNILQTGIGNSDGEKYGSGYLLSLQSNYARLQRLNFDKKNAPRKKSFRTAHNNNKLRNIYEADFEIRINRPTGDITLLINGAFYAEWNDPEPFLNEVPRYFAIEAQQQSLLRINDVSIAEWNGMPDSARSMQSDDRDIVLLTNGTDRFSGELLTLEENILRIQSDYATFQMPLTDVTDIQLATETRSPASATKDSEVLVSIQPHGQITLDPHEGVAGRLRGTHSVLGDLDLDLAFSYLIEFDPDATIFDNWDNDF